MAPEVAALAIGAIVVAALSWRDKRAVGYISVGALNFALNYMWALNEMPYPPVMNAVSDASMCLLVYVVGRYRWEMWLWRIYQCSVLVSILHLAGMVPGAVTYAVALEAVNWAALLLLGGTALTRMVGDGSAALGLPRRYLRRLDASLRSQRTHPSWWHA